MAWDEMDSLRGNSMIYCSDIQGISIILVIIFGCCCVASWPIPDMHYDLIMSSSDPSCVGDHPDVPDLLTETHSIFTQSSPSDNTQQQQHQHQQHQHPPQQDCNTTFLSSATPLQTPPPRLSWPIETNTPQGDTVINYLEWSIGDNLYHVFQAFKAKNGIMLPPDCQGKESLIDIEWCMFNHLSMYMTREMITKELVERQQTQHHHLPPDQILSKYQYWDFAAAYSSTSSYSHFEDYILVHGTLALQPDLLRTAIEVLRECVRQEEGRFAPSLHTLTNCLYSLYEETGKEELLREIEHWLRLSLDLTDEEKEQKYVPVTKHSDPHPCPPIISATAVHWVTVASSERPQLQALRQSIHAVGGNLTVLGAGEAWRGLGSKVTYMDEHLSTWGTEHPCELICFVDAYDVVALPFARHLAQQFKSLMKSVVIRRDADSMPVVFSTETACSPDRGMKVLYHHRLGKGPQATSGPLHYLNSGTYMGRVREVHQMIKRVLQDIQEHHGYNGVDTLELDDQRWFTRHLFRFPGAVLSDDQAKIFHTLFQLQPNDFVIDEGGEGGQVRLRSLVTRGEPCILHGNGGAHHELFESLREKGWPPSAFLGDSI